MHFFRFFFLIFIFLLPFKIWSQNIVSNGNFETTGDCINYFSQPEAAPPWFNPTASTPDYYYGSGECGYSAFNNPSGFQLPHSGSAYAGLWVFTTGGIGTREYIEQELINQLDSGTIYSVSFYVSRAEYSRYASDRIGAYFSEDSITSTNYLNLPVIPQIENQSGNILTDTLNWTLISNLFIADGGEKFITIGNFRDETQTQWIDVNPLSGWGCSYYYIDDVTVEKAKDDFVSEVKFPLIKKIFPNPFYDHVTILLTIPYEANNSDFSIQLDNIIGQKYYPSFKIVKNGNDVIIEIDKVNLCSGTYLLKIKTGNYSVVEKVIIN